MHVHVFIFFHFLESIFQIISHEFLHQFPPSINSWDFNPKASYQRFSKTWSCTFKLKHIPPTNCKNIRFHIFDVFHHSMQSNDVQFQILNLFMQSNFHHFLFKLICCHFTNYKMWMHPTSPWPKLVDLIYFVIVIS